MEPNRKSNYSYIERVNDHRSCYRIKTNDGLKLELDKSEIGRFIPQKGMSVQIRLFNGTVLQEVFLNGICVVRRSPLFSLSRETARLMPSERKTPWNVI